MDVATLVSALMPLLDDPVGNSARILKLLRDHRTLADYEVARFLVAKRTEPFVCELLQSQDPKSRRTAVRWVGLTFARAPAARVLRDATKDRAKMVRQAAFRATRELRLDDVALPDTTDHAAWVHEAPQQRRMNPFTGEEMVVRGSPPRAARQRGYDVSGWRFGLYPTVNRRRDPKPAFSALRSREDVERVLGVSRAQLSRMIRPGHGSGRPYVAFEIPKATGGVRTLHAPRPALKRVQRLILERLLAPLEVHAAAHGFVRGRSTITNAIPHVGARIVVKMDLIDFFPTIHFGRLVGLFQHYGASVDAARTLAAVVTYRPTLPDGRVSWPSVLPQGAPTSPVLSNLVCRRLDSRLTALAASVAAHYTRYADDLTFSFREEPTKGLGHFLWWVNQIIGQEGFRENLGKRRILRPTGQLRVTGLVTNSGLSVPRDARRRFRAILHDCRQRGVTAEATGHEEPRAYLLGFSAYVQMVQPATGAKLRAEVLALLARR
ncbi:MAG: RNA-directed DNA polymerase [Deltaproteobacteria bacterium]|nr:RNA-directed DNA polymerase [Deltaproteobacteria bacterium]